MGSFSPDGARMAYEDFRSVGGQVFSELWIGGVGGDTRISEMLGDAQEDQFPSWSPDGRWIAFGRRRLGRQGGLGSQLMLFDVSSSTLRQLTADPNYNNTAFAWSPSGDAILVQRFDLQTAPGGSSLWVYALAGDRLKQIVSDGYGAAWLP
jgi:Tol biopolymer transport system component